jgi:hypothetical protein
MQCSSRWSHQATSMTFERMKPKHHLVTTSPRAGLETIRHGRKSAAATRSKQPHAASSHTQQAATRSHTQQAPSPPGNKHAAPRRPAAHAARNAVGCQHRETPGESGLGPQAAGEACRGRAACGGRQQAARSKIEPGLLVSNPLDAPAAEARALGRRRPARPAPPRRTAWLAVASRLLGCTRRQQLAVPAPAPAPAPVSVPPDSDATPPAAVQYSTVFSHSCLSQDSARA